MAAPETAPPRSATGACCRAGTNNNELPAGTAEELAELRRDFKACLTRAEWDSIASVLSSEEESESLSGPATAQQVDTEHTRVYSAFMRIWSLKESFVKARGDGLGFELGNCEFALAAAVEDGEPVLRSVLGEELSQRGSSLDAWRFSQHALPSGHWHALAFVWSGSCGNLARGGNGNPGTKKLAQVQGVDADPKRVATTQHGPVAVAQQEQPEERGNVVDPKTTDVYKQRIFLGMASFRDPRCAKTLVNAARNAKHPERIVFAVVEENDRKPQHKNEECVPNLRPNSEEEKQGLSDADRAFWRATIDAETQLRVNNTITADCAAGCADARSHLMALYEQDEKENRVPYFLLTDPHVFFTHHWDVLLVNMIEGVDENGDPLPIATDQQMSEHGGLLPPGVLPKGFNPRKSVFTAYPNDKHEPEGTGERQGEFAREQVPVINEVYYMDQETIMQASVGCTIQPGTYAASRTLGGGLLAMPGKALTDVPLDTHMQGLHQGEEVLWAARLWTTGYDLYAPTYNLLTHDYHRKPGDPNDVPVLPTTAAMMENSGRAKKKVKALLSGDNENSLAKESIELGFGMGTQRSLSDFLHNWLNFDTEPGRAAPVGEKAKKAAQENWTRKDGVCPDAGILHTIWPKLPTAATAERKVGSGTKQEEKFKASQYPPLLYAGAAIIVGVLVSAFLGAVWLPHQRTGHQK
eukprot:g563.t1